MRASSEEVSEWGSGGPGLLTDRAVLLHRRMSLSECQVQQYCVLTTQWNPERPPPGQAVVACERQLARVIASVSPFNGACVPPSADLAIKVRLQGGDLLAVDPSPLSLKVFSQPDHSALGRRDRDEKVVVEGQISVVTQQGSNETTLSFKPFARLPRKALITVRLPVALCSCLLV